MLIHTNSEKKKDFDYNTNKLLIILPRKGNVIIDATKVLVLRILTNI